MGRRARDTWPEEWAIIGPKIDDMMSLGTPSWNEDVRVPIFRDGILEETYWTYGHSPVFDEAGGIGGVLVICTETTERVVAARHEHAARQVAEMANRAKDEFLATVSHELRTPLTAMLGWARMLTTGKVPPSRYEHALRVIERNAVAQARLIDDLLDVSRITSGNMRLHRTAVDLVKLVESTIDSVKPVIDAKSIELEGLHVLVVDDEADTRAFLMTVLADCGAILLEASSAAEALDLLAERRPDVMISDVGMPGENGYSLIRRARLLPLESGAGIPAAALTAYTSDEDRSQALVAGYQMHLPKPVDPAELVAVVANLARIARSIK